MNLPARIDPCPILETILEVRFSSDEIIETIFGLFKRELKSDFPNYERLPIMDFPEVIRINEPNLKFQPYYKFKNNSWDINLGPNVLTIIKKNSYCGWDEFSDFTSSIFLKLKSIDVIKSIDRLGLRYINFFETNIYNNIDVNISLGSDDWTVDETFIKRVFDKDNHKVILQLGNKSTLNKGNTEIYGSILDIDILFNLNGTTFLDNPQGFLNVSHNIEKEIFFSLLKDDYIKTLNPVY